MQLITRIVIMLLVTIELKITFSLTVSNITDVPRVSPTYYKPTIV